MYHQIAPHFYGMDRRYRCGLLQLLLRCFSFQTGCLCHNETREWLVCRCTSSSNSSKLELESRNPVRSPLWHMYISPAPRVNATGEDHTDSDIHGRTERGTSVDGVSTFHVSQRNFPPVSSETWPCRSCVLLRNTRRGALDPHPATCPILCESCISFRRLSPDFYPLSSRISPTPSPFLGVPSPFLCGQHFRFDPDRSDCWVPWPVDVEVASTFPSFHSLHAFCCSFTEVEQCIHRRICWCWTSPLGGCGRKKRSLPRTSVLAETDTTLDRKSEPRKWYHRHQFSEVGG